MSANRPILFCARREQWRDWLAKHFETTAEIWLVFPVKASGEEGVSYNDAVEEALCFGWIDSTAGTLDEKHQLRRFTPRKKGSPYSRPNIERLIWLEAGGLIHPTVRESVLGLIQTPYSFPEDILAALHEDETVWRHYSAFSEPYKRIRVAYIDAAEKACPFHQIHKAEQADRRQWRCRQVLFPRVREKHRPREVARNPLTHNELNKENSEIFGVLFKQLADNQQHRCHLIVPRAGALLQANLQALN